MSDVFGKHIIVKTTRKQHRCVWCGEPIVVGTSCMTQSGIYEGEAFSHHYHHECAYDQQLCIQGNGGQPIEFTFGEADREEILARLKFC